MAVDHIRYDLLTQDALRGLIRTVLADVAAKGLPGEHHFFITFDTRVDGVRISGRLKASYPEEMTVVLQHQFWDLTVGEDDFGVELAFNGTPERLHIPFSAVKAFFDPSVQFGLQFAIDGEAARGASADSGAEIGAAPAPPAAAEKHLPAAPSAPAEPPKRPPKKEPPAAGKPGPVPSCAGDSGAEVVRLDRFRKK